MTQHSSSATGPDPALLEQARQLLGGVGPAEALDVALSVLVRDRLRSTAVTEEVEAWAEGRFAGLRPAAAGGATG